jgi:peptidoglycan/xylan/chitin deacetylase (PgdA/CDA1 family)
MGCERQFLARFGERQPARSRILCYHAVGTPAWGVNDLAPDRFRRQIETALAAGYRFVPPDFIASDPEADEPRLAITFDDGLQSVIDNAAPILADYGIPWMFFVVTDWAEGKHNWDPAVIAGWDAIERAASLGGSIGSHAVTHPNFGRISAQQAELELYESRLVIESRLGIVPTAFAIPFGQSRDWTSYAQQTAERAGYRTIYAQSEERRHEGTVGRTFITRFDDDRLFRAALAGAYDRWEEWV